MYDWADGIISTNISAEQMISVEGGIWLICLVASASPSILYHTACTFLFNDSQHSQPACLFLHVWFTLPLQLYSAQVSDRVSCFTDAISKRDTSLHMQVTKCN